MKIADILEEKRQQWPGACSLVVEIEDYSGACWRCGWSVEDHEYLANAVELLTVCIERWRDDESEGSGG